MGRDDQSWRGQRRPVLEVRRRARTCHHERCHGAQLLWRRAPRRARSPATWALMPDGSARSQSQIASDATRRLDEWLRETGVLYEFVMPGVPMPTVPSAASAIGVSEDQ